MRRPSPPFRRLTVPVDFKAGGLDFLIFGDGAKSSAAFNYRRFPWDKMMRFKSIKCKLSTLFRREFLVTFILLEFFCLSVMVAYIAGRVFSLKDGFSYRDALAALFVSGAGVIVYIFHRLVSKIIDR
jgi:hypothetical protein